MASFQKIESGAIKITVNHDELSALSSIDDFYKLIGIDISDKDRLLISTDIVTSLPDIFVSNKEGDDLFEKQGRVMEENIGKIPNGIDWVPENTVYLVDSRETALDFEWIPKLGFINGDEALYLLGDVNEV